MRGVDHHTNAGRPTVEAASDKTTADEIYQDNESGYYIFISSRGRTHIFMTTGQHHTSFRTKRANRESRIGEGKWERIKA